MDDLIDQVSNFWAAHQRLTDSVSSTDLSKLKSHPNVQSAYFRLSRDELSLAELSTNTARGKVSTVHSRNSWSIALIRGYVTYADIVLSPYPSIMVPFDEDSNFTVENYLINETDLHKSRIQHSGAVQLCGKETITFGGTWMTPGIGVCANISGANEDSTILIVHGPPYAPYTHVFGADLQYKSSSFASDAYNGRVFFSDLIKHSIFNELQVSCEQAEVDRLKTYIEETTARRDAVSEEVWPLVQSMSALDHNAAVGLLSKLSASRHELAPMARRTLLANGIDADACQN